MSGERRPSRTTVVKRSRSLAGVALALAGLAGAGAVRPSAADRPRREAAPLPRLSPESVAALPSPARRLLADASWLAAVQYYGGRRLAGSGDFPRLQALVENALRLDPGLRAAAVSGALLLAEAPPLGAGVPRRAAAILRVWTRRNPQDFEAVLIRALLHHWHFADPGEAARILAEASGRAGAPRWLRELTARSLAEVGAREAARGLWRALLAHAGDPRARANARTHLLQLDALDERDRLVALAAGFARREGRPPEDWGDLVAAGLLPAAPLDPAGVPYELDGAGTPRIAPASPLAGHPGR